MRIHTWLTLALLTSVLHAEAQHEPAKPPVPVSVRTVERSTAAGGVRYSADIKPARQVDLAFRVSGYIQELLQVPGPDGRQRDVQEGDRVTKGTRLAQVRDSTMW
jgi:multidrug efflux pump subunit AcrA (membrane-fusion protein)